MKDWHSCWKLFPLTESFAINPPHLSVLLLRQFRRPCGVDAPLRLQFASWIHASCKHQCGGWIADQICRLEQFWHGLQPYNLHQSQTHQFLVGYDRLYDTARRISTSARESLSVWLLRGSKDIAPAVDVASNWLPRPPADAMPITATLDTVDSKWDGRLGRRFRHASYLLMW